MSGTKILWGQILIVFLIVLISVWTGTQWTAWRLGFQPQLGPPWFDLWGIPVYYPPALFWWWYFYDAYAPRIFVEGGIIAASGGFLAIAVAIFMSVCARARPNMSRPTARPMGGAEEVRRQGCSAPTVSCSADTIRTICATMARSMCSASPPPAPARASGWWCRPC
ncbi:hypothetical protein [Paracoccus mutanolyticus]|uniref:hypothetical protein n=1 Tax=Paracoccus mutanolyticus TaxID=1499308 RepID=UPI0021D523F4|nr:hypothetical protein [Paracoccus mutanolyticus]